MFGHTFLRIDSSFKSRLLSHAVNYSAQADENKESAVGYMLKGLFGGYLGKYSLLPYYDKLKEYRDTEQRDIWEYDLNLSEEEVKNMVDHIWELSNAHSYYYFFDENCSYNMLWLMEIARPTVQLRDYFIYQVSPPETIFAIEKEGLVKEKKYRASKRSIILTYESKLSDEYLEMVKKLSMGKIDPKTILQDNSISKEYKSYILEMAIELCEYNFIKVRLKKENYLKTFHNLSSARASLGKVTSIEVPTPANPDLGHRQLKVSLGNTHETNSNTNYQTLGLRLSYHDLTNNDTGFLKGTQIEFFNTQARYSEDEHLELDYLKFVTISSIAPRTEIFKSLSWKTAWQYDRDALNNDLNFTGNVSGGLAWRLLGESYTYLLADLYIYDTDYAKASYGSTLGFVLYETNSFKTNIETTYKQYNTDHQQRLVNFTQSYFPHKNIDLKLNYKYVEKFDYDQKLISFQINYFF